MIYRCYHRTSFDEHWLGLRCRVQFFAPHLWRFGLWRLHRDRYGLTLAFPTLSIHVAK